MEVLDLELIKLLYLRFTTIFGDRFTKNYPTEQLVKLWWADWLQGLTGINPENIKNAIDHCLFNLVWPPSICEFRQLCERDSGFPTEDQVMQAAIREDFSHPITKLVYDRIGSWDMKHDTSKELKKKIYNYYQEEVENYRMNLHKKQKQLIVEKDLSPDLSKGIDNEANKRISSDSSRQPRGNSMRQATDYLF